MRKKCDTDYYLGCGSHLNAKIPTSKWVIQPLLLFRRNFVREPTIQCVYIRERVVFREHNRKPKRNEAFLLDKQKCASVEMLYK